MEKNVGDIDRIARYVFGVAIIAVGIYAKSWWGLIGILPLITGTIRWCPAYLPFGINTCRTKNKPR